MWSSLKHFSESLFGKRNTSSRKRRGSNRKLQCETLEGRELFALLAGETLVNTTTAREQYDVASATNASGRSVVVWTHEYSSSDTDVYAQRYDAAGKKLGGEIKVASTSRNEGSAEVSIDLYGDFVVAWCDEGATSNIKAQRFSSDGSLRGSVINVATTTKDESAPSIASDANGNFVISWTVEYGPGDDDVKAKRYLDDGSLAKAFTVADSASNETYSDVAMAPDGRFAISYRTGENTVAVKRYSSSASLVNTHTVTGLNGRISMDNNANTFVVYQNLVAGDYDVFVRRISNAGALGSTITVASTSANEMLPEIAAKRDGTAFVVTYNASGLKVAEFTSSGTLKKRETVGTQNQLEAMPVNFASGGDYTITRSRTTNSTLLHDIYRRKGTLS